MEWFDLAGDDGEEPGGVLELPESRTGPHVALELHVTFGAGGRTIAYWMLDDGIFVAEVGAGLA